LHSSKSAPTWADLVLQTCSAYGRSRHIATLPTVLQPFPLVVQDSRAVVAANAAQSALKEKVKELQARAREAATANDKLVSAKLVNPEVGLDGKQHSCF